MALTKVQIGMTDAPTSGTAVTASGTSVDFTGIPSTAKRITVMLQGISTSGASFMQVQIGVGSTPTTSGYSSGSTYALIGSSGTSGGTSTAGFVIFGNAATYLISGHTVITNISGNNWVASGVIYNSATTPYTGQHAGIGSLSGALGMIRITTVNGTDTFDAGTINIMWE